MMYMIIIAVLILCIQYAFAVLGDVHTRLSSLFYFGIAIIIIVPMLPYSSLLQPGSATGYLVHLVIQKYPVSLTGITTSGCLGCARIY
jgi:hypothetical protein